ncbi:MAG: hypothetical protein ABSF34_19030, partial [Verrucomicrobiota bacterium]
PPVNPPFNPASFVESEPIGPVPPQGFIETQIGRTESEFKEEFIRANQPAFDKALAERMEDDRVTLKLPEIVRKVEEKKLQFERLTTIIGSFKTGDFGKSIYAAMDAHYADVGSIQQIASELAGAYILSVHGDSILKNCRADWDDAESALSLFKQQHYARLQRLHLTS